MTHIPLLLGGIFALLGGALIICIPSNNINTIAATHDHQGSGSSRVKGITLLFGTFSVFLSAMSAGRHETVSFFVCRYSGWHVIRMVE